MRDEAGRVEQLDQSLGNVHFSTLFAYDERDRLVEKTFPDGEKYQWNYDGLRLETITSPDPNKPDILLNATYDAMGRFKVLDVAGTAIERKYNGPGKRLSDITVGPNGNKLDLALEFDGLGRLAKMTEVFDGWGGSSRDLKDREFTYDGMGRLKTANGPWEQPGVLATWTYHYDPLGNLRKQASTGLVSHAWSYSDATRVRFLTQFKRYNNGGAQGTPILTDTMTADLSGNPATINSGSLAWSGQARMKIGPSGTTSYYDVYGRKTIEDVPGAAVHLHPSDDFLYNPDNGMANKFFRVDGLLVATRATWYSAPYYSQNPVVRWVVDPVRQSPGPALLLLFLVGSAGLISGVVRRRPPLWARAAGSTLVSLALVLLPYNSLLAVTVEEQTGPLPNGNHGDDLLIYGTDHLGSTRVLLDETGAIVEARDYSPFGDTISHDGLHNLRHRFTGQQYLEPDELYDYAARRYSSTRGAFVSPDESVEAFNAQALNPYTYVRNEPTSRIDPSGLTSESPIPTALPFASAGLFPRVDPIEAGIYPDPDCCHVRVAYPSIPTSGQFLLGASIAAAVEPTPFGELVLGIGLLFFALGRVDPRADLRERRQDPYSVRIQAQGPGLSQELRGNIRSKQRITSGDGQQALARLRAALGKDAEILAGPLAAADRFIAGAGPGGVRPFSRKSFYVTGGGGLRVDVSSLSGEGNFATGPRSSAYISPAEPIN